MMVQGMTEILDADCKAFLDESQWAKDVDFQDLTIAQARKNLDAQFRTFGAPHRPVGQSRITRIATGDAEFSIHLTWPEQGSLHQQRPLLVWFHGGGWTLGSAEAQSALCRYLCAEAGVVVANVDYRLAPEWPFPAGPDDALQAFRWLVENAGELGIDPRRIAVAGASAGASLATVLCQMTLQEGGVQPAYQALFYPCVTLQADPPYASRKRLGTGEFGLTLAEMDWLRGCFLREESDAADPRASPILAADLRGLPAALIVAAQCDPLVDEAFAYANRLEQDGVATEYLCVPGAIHGFVEVPGRLPQGQLALDLLADRLRQRFFDILVPPEDGSGEDSR